MNKRIVLIIVLFICLVSSTIGAFALDFKSKNEAPLEVLEIANNDFRMVVDTISVDLEDTTGQIFDNDKFSIGKEYYRVNYVNDIDLTEKHSKLQDIMVYSDEWLFIIEYNNEPISYMLIGHHNNSYDLLMYGGNAEMFNKSLSFLNSSGHNNLRVLSYMNDFYLINGRDEVVQVPTTKETYERHPSYYNKPLQGVDCLNIILDQFKQSIDRKHDEVEYGANSLIEAFYKNKN